MAAAPRARHGRAIRLLAAALCLAGLPFAVGTLDGRASDARALIRRDTYGVPHILGETEEQAAVAHGYATAEDHSQTLARLFLRARGELSLQFGKETIEEDVDVRRIGIHERATRQYPLLPPLTQRLLSGYARGYNLYLESHASRFPAWAAPITGIDVLAHCYAVLLLDFSSIDRLALRGKVPRTLPQPSASGDAAAVEEEMPLGSNMWAIGRGRSASGRGILLANPHVPWRGAHLFHEVQITVPGRINVAGATLLGFPVVGIGFNETLGWTHTVNSRDADDLYELTLDPTDPSRYLYDGEALPFTRRKVTVRVKTATGIDEVTREVEWAHYGPVVERSGGKALALKSANLADLDFITAWNAMGKATSLPTFQAALDLQALPMFNIGYADRAGDVYYVFNGRIPRRPDGYDWAGIVPGDTSVTEWQGLHAVADLPQVLNPPGGYVQNCNDPPWYATLKPLVDATRYPAYLTRDTLGLRGQFSLATLESRRKLSIDEVKALKWDPRVLLAERVKPELVALARRAPPADDLAEAAAVLGRWDDRSAIDSRGGVLFVRWWSEYTRRAKPVYRTPLSKSAPLTTPRGLGDPAAAVVALKAARDGMRQDRQALDVPWGTVYRLRHAGLDLPLSGMPQAFRTIGYQRDKDGKMAAVFGDSYVLVVEFGAPLTAYSVLAYSESSDPQSPHATDQSRLFAESRFKRLWFTEAEIAQHLERAYRPGE